MHDSVGYSVFVGCKRVVERWVIKNLEALIVIKGLFDLIV